MIQKTLGKPFFSQHAKAKKLLVTVQIANIHVIYPESMTFILVEQ